MSKITDINEFLTEQGMGHLAIVQAIPDDANNVQITPVTSDLECACDYSFVVPRQAIGSITPTGEYRNCCGKHLQIVSVEFVAGAALPVAKVMALLATKPIAENRNRGWCFSDMGCRNLLTGIKVSQDSCRAAGGLSWMGDDNICRHLPGLTMR